jgi:sugar lactone lactonase YvrE
MTELTTLMTGISLGESPRWHDGRLWFCDWGAQQVIAVDSHGNSEVMFTIDSFPFSIDWLPDGPLLIHSSHDRRLLRREANGSFVTHADLSGLSEWGFNEIVVDGRGNAYVNAVNFDFMGGEPPRGGIIAVVASDGSARQVADEVMFPNGMAVTPDNSTLIVAESHANRLTAFDIADSGDLSNRRVWADLGAGAPDGICIDAEGAVWYADVPHKHCVRVAEGGEVLHTIEVDRGCFACMLGGEDGRTLFIVAAEWNGPAQAGHGPPRGVLLAGTIDVPHDGWP